MAPSQDDILAHFREQAGFCAALGSPFMQALCLAMATDIEKRGPVSKLVKGWKGNPRRDALSLRIAGFLHYCVLSGAAPQLAAAYPAANPDWTMEQVWPVARALLAERATEAALFIQSPPQTNETRRAIALLPGFLKTASLYPGPMHLLELGASAGLNLNWDRFTYKTHRWELSGEPSIEIDTEWDGPPPDHLDIAFNIVSRAACDQSPINVNEPDAALRLASYFWPDQPERLARLDAAMDLARRTRVSVDAADAAEWLAAKLAARPEEGVTVVYHSVFLQYPPAETRRALQAMLEEEGAAATFERPLAWLCFEPGAFFQGEDQVGIDPNDFITYLRVWPDNETHRLLRSDGHVRRVQPL
ncbi:DUF2332 domain-containing protein [Hyphomonas sp. WL0036]|uniref:DUF2332 domain-containing protein n=1 Tax=Hyphomonas sediminis TaxID=2866160 RepID=UPI001C801F8B|nr:DUF2332 domain-containing protein [Hyphomonas sediminis]